MNEILPDDFPNTQEVNAVEVSNSDTAPSKKKMYIVFAVLLLLLLALFLYIVISSPGAGNGPKPTAAVPTATSTDVTTTMVLTGTPSLTISPTSLNPSTTPRTTTAPTATIRPTNTSVPGMTAAPTNTPLPPTATTVPFAATNASITTSAICYEYDGLQGYPFSHSFNFTGNITANGAGNVVYIWQPNPAVPVNQQIVIFKTAGTAAVNPSTITLTINTWDGSYAYGSMHLDVTSPNSIASNTVDVVLANNRNGIHPCPVNE